MSAYIPSHNSYFKLLNIHFQRRQDELEKRAQELDRREEELRSAPQNGMSTVIQGPLEQMDGIATKY